MIKMSSSIIMSDWQFLSNTFIENLVQKNSKGVYILADLVRDYLYVGRSDENINERLKSHVGEKSRTKKREYKWFKFKLSSTIRSAFEDECRLYHEYKPPDNINHPNKPKDTDYTCPVCE